MRILWIGKQPVDGEAGDEIFDRKTIAACRAFGHTIDLLHPVPATGLQRLGNLMLGLPYYRTRFASAANMAAIRERSGSYDAVVCSWEPFDALVRRLSPPCIMILHNVTSRSLPALSPHNPLAALAGAYARVWERGIYRPDQFAAIATLSRRDLAYLERLERRPKLMLLPPGMPPCAELAADAPLLREIVISGTFNWAPKHRDVLVFAREYAGVARPALIRAAGLPADAARHLKAILSGLPEQTSDALRFGLITDRFEAGHKLKTLAYIAANQIVLSFADVKSDFEHIRDHGLFIRKIVSAAEIGSHIDALAAMHVQELRDRFVAFKKECARVFAWHAVAATILNKVTEIASRNHEEFALAP